ncbi:MAG: hypothetical protein Aurels2KO_39920 [Aureliella sp.]
MKRLHTALLALGILLHFGSATVLAQATQPAVEATEPASRDGESDQTLLVSPPESGKSPVPAESTAPTSDTASLSTEVVEPVADTVEVAPKRAVSAAISQARSLSLAFRHASAKALPSVVMILSRISDEGDEAANEVRDMLDSGANFDSVGSGVIISSDGLVLTNQHVIKDAKRIQVRLADGRRFNVAETKGDPKSDVAILRIEGQDLPAAELGDSRDLFVGDWCLAIGSPFTLQSSVSAGIISGKDRWHSLSKDVSGLFLQVDATINPGNSGGPLVDLDGKIVGINTAITSRNGGFQGIGFSIPINRADWIKDELLEHGRVRRGYAGVRTSDIPYSVAKELKLNIGSGAYVVSTTPGRAADKAGFEIGDIILTYNGVPVDSGGKLAELIQQSKIGEPLPVVVRREDKKVTLSFVPEEKQ